MTPKVMSRERFWRLANKKDDIVLAPPWEANRTILAKNVAVKLTKKYPGHHWAIGFPEIGGGIFVRAMGIPTNFMLFIREKDINGPEYGNILNLAGEMLERFNISRSAPKSGEYESIQSKRIVVPDVTNIPASNMR